MSSNEEKMMKTASGALLFMVSTTLLMMHLEYNLHSSLNITPSECYFEHGICHYKGQFNFVSNEIFFENVIILFVVQFKDFDFV